MTRRLAVLNGAAMALFTFAGAVLLGAGGLLRTVFAIGALLLGSAFMARLLRGEIDDSRCQARQHRSRAPQGGARDLLLEKPDRGQTADLRMPIDGMFEAIEEEEGRRREAKRQRLLAFLAPLEAARREQDEPSGTPRRSSLASSPFHDQSHSWNTPISSPKVSSSTNTATIE